MTRYEISAIIISLIALGATLINIIFYVRLTIEYNSLVKEQNRISQGEAETSIRTLIMSARQEVDTASEKIANSLGSCNDEQKKIFEKIFESAQEDLRNAYEEACSRYLDQKIDKERFKRIYFTEIQNLVEDQDQKVYFSNNQSKYKAVIKVYKEWFDLEN